MRLIAILLLTGCAGDPIRIPAIDKASCNEAAWEGEALSIWQRCAWHFRAKYK